MKTIQVAKKSDIQAPYLTYESYRFEKEGLYVCVSLSWNHNEPVYTITYWQKWKKQTVAFISHCKTERGVISKVAKFLNVK